MENTYSYRANAHWTMHKRGILEAADIPRTINFAAPPEFGGEPGLWTPEHLLLGAAYRNVDAAHPPLVIDGCVQANEGVQRRLATVEGASLDLLGYS